MIIEVSDGMFHAAGYSSKRLDLLVNKVKGLKQKTNVSKGKPYRSKRICGICGTDFTDKDLTRFCKQACWNFYRRFYT